MLFVMLIANFKKTQITNIKLYQRPQVFKRWLYFYHLQLKKTVFLILYSSYLSGNCVKHTLKLYYARRKHFNNNRYKILAKHKFIKSSRLTAESQQAMIAR